MATDLTNITGSVLLNAGVNASNISALTESVANDSLNWTFTSVVDLGTTYDQMWHDNAALAKEASDTIDLQAQVNSFGHTCVFTEVSNIIIKNSTTSAAIATYFIATTDGAQATWAATDVVQNFTDDGETAGSQWTGTIHHVIDASNFVVLLVTGTYDLVIDADGIDNDTRSQEDGLTKSLVTDPQLKIGVAAANPVDFWLSTTEFEWLNPNEYTAHAGTWTVAAGSKNLKIENLGLIPAQYEIIVLGNEI